MDGEITIGTRLDTDKFDRQVSDLEKKMQKEEDKKIVLGAKIEVQKEMLEEAIKKTDELAEAYQKLKQVQDTIASGKATPEQFEIAQNIQNTYGSMTQLETSFLRALNKQDEINIKTEQMKAKYQEINDKVSEYKQKIENVKIQKQVSDVDKLKNSFNSVGSSIQKSIKNVARLALGIFGVRSAFMFLRRASSDLASYDQQYAANIEYIRYALTQMIAPVLQWIVRLAATLLGYINAIVQGWFGINLFSRGSAKNFQKMKAGAGGVSKAVKEIKKQLAGFDEINMLTDQSDSGAGGGGGAGGAMPEFDLSKMQGEPPAWLKWIIDNRDLVLSIIAGLLAGMKALLPLIEQYGLKLGLIKALGIGLMVAGIVYSIQSLIAYLNDPSWTNFGKIIQGIGIAIIGLGALIGSVPVAVAGAIILIVGTIIRYWEQIKGFLQGGIDWLKGKSDWVHQMFGDTIGNIYDITVKDLQLILNWFDMTFNNIKQILDGIIQFVKGVFTGNWREAWEGVRKIFAGIFDWIKNTFFTLIDIAWNGLSRFADTIGNVVASIFKNIVNGVLRTIENVLNSPIRTINRLIGVINAVPGINLNTLPTFNLPRLKTGGIINMPNKGTMLGSAIGGESGKEGVLPLTDTQAMAELGREIGRWININATIPISVGNRQIAREMRRINAEDSFAYNL